MIIVGVNGINGINGNMDPYTAFYLVIHTNGTSIVYGSIIPIPPTVYAYPTQPGCWSLLTFLDNSVPP